VWQFPLAKLIFRTPTGRSKNYMVTNKVTICGKGVTVKESEISRGLVSPAQRALKKKIDFGQILAGKIMHQAHTQNGLLIFQI